MPVAKDIIQDALEWIGAYAPGQPMNAADGARGLAVFNDMLDSWSNENLSCYTVNEQSVTLVPGERSYTIGNLPTADVIATRPINLRSGPGAAYILDNNGNIYGVDVITRAQWNLRGSRNTNSNFPDVLFYDAQFPLGVLNFDPIPNIGYTAYFDSMLQLSDYATLVTPVLLPPGYKLALQRNLGLELWPYYFPEKEPSATRKEQAAYSKANVKRSNIRLDVAVFDPEITARAPGIWNIYTDSYRR